MEVVEEMAETKEAWFCRLWTTIVPGVGLKLLRAEAEKNLLLLLLLKKTEIEGVGAGEERLLVVRMDPSLLLDEDNRRGVAGGRLEAVAVRTERRREAI